MDQRQLPSIDFDEESRGDRFIRKSKEAPFVPLGLAGCVGAVIYGVYQFKNKGQMSTSVYLMKFRVIAQSAVVCTLGVGMAYSMFNQYVLPKFQTVAASADVKKDEKS